MLELLVVAVAAFVLWTINRAVDERLAEQERRDAAAFAAQYEACVDQLLQQQLEPGSMIYFDDPGGEAFTNERIAQVKAERAHLILEGHAPTCDQVRYGPTKRTYMREGFAERERRCTCRMATRVSPEAF